MTKSVTYTVKMARPCKPEIDSLYALMHAAEAIDNRWSRETQEEFKERLHYRELSDEEQAFLLTAWDILTNRHSGALGRILGAYSTLSATFSDESLDYVAASPAINAMYNDSLILTEVMEAYREARHHIAALEAIISIPIKVPKFDGYKPHVVRELQAAFIQSVKTAGLTISVPENNF